MHRRIACSAFILTLSVAGLGCRSERPDGAVRPGEVQPAASARTETPTKPLAEDVAWSALEGKTVLVMTRPTVALVRSFETLVRNKLLDVSELFLVGLYHAQEQHRYREARKYVASRGLSWIGFRRLSCALDAPQVFGKNACTKAFRAVVAHATGLVFNGGPDIPPQLYGEKTRLTTAIRDPQRHYWEISLLFHLLGGSRNSAHQPLLRQRPNMPIFAICLGLQHMNVATGGTLIQDIPSEVYGVSSQEAILELDPDQRHRNPHRALNPRRGVTGGVLHSIRWVGDKRLWQTITAARQPTEDPSPVRVMSIHHQAVEKLGRGLQVAATSMDGKIVEALTHRRYPNVLGVQFHPEHRTIWSPSVKAQISVDHPLRNAPSAMLKDDERSQAFHVGLWRLFAHRLQAEQRRRATSKSERGE